MTNGGVGVAIVGWVVFVTTPMLILCLATMLWGNVGFLPLWLVPLRYIMKCTMFLIELASECISFPQCDLESLDFSFCVYLS